MTTPIWIAGAEAGIIAKGASATAPLFSDIFTTAPELETTIICAGGSTASFKFQATRYTHWYPAATQHLVSSFDVYFSAISGGTIGFTESRGATVGCVIYMASADSKLYCQFDYNGGTGTPVAASSTVSATTWYHIDMDVDTSANPSTCDWKIDGVAQTQATFAQAANDMDAWEMGNFDSSISVYIDNVVVSATKADYPIGHTDVIGYSPNVDGTHSFTANDFKYNNTTAFDQSVTDVSTYLDEKPITATTDYITQAVARAAGYCEVGFADTGRTGTDVAIGLTILMSFGSTTNTGASTLTVKLNDGGTLADPWAAIDPSFLAICYANKVFALAPSSSAAWTATLIDALKVRFGYASDVTPVPNVYGLMIEVAWGAVEGGGWANIAKVNGVTSSAIAKMNGVAVAGIAKINGVAV